MKIQSFLHKFISSGKLSNFEERLVGSFLWNSLGAVSSRGSLLLANILVARIVGLTTFGEFLIVTTTILSVGVLVDLGLGLTATKYTAEYQQVSPEKIRNLLVFLILMVVLTGLSIGSGLFFYAKEVAAYLEAPQLEHLVRIASLLPLFLAASSIGAGVIAGLEQFKKLASINIVMGFSNVVGMGVGASVAGVEGVLWANLILSILNVIMVTYVLAGCIAGLGVAFQPLSLRSEFKNIFTFTLPAFLIGLTYGPATFYCSALLVKTENGFEEMAILGASMQWFAVVLFLPASLAAVVLPVSSSLASSSSGRAYRGIIINAAKSSFLLSIPIVILISLLSSHIMGLYGNDFVEGAEVLVITIISAVFVSMQMNIGNTLSAKGKVWGQLGLNICQALIFVGLTKFWIENGAFGLALAKTVSYLFLLVGSLAYAFFITIDETGTSIKANGPKDIQ